MIIHFKITEIHYFPSNVNRRLIVGTYVLFVSISIIKLWIRQVLQNLNFLTFFYNFRKSQDLEQFVVNRTTGPGILTFTPKIDLKVKLIKKKIAKTF